MKNKISRRSFLAAAAVSAAALAVTGCDAKTSKKAVTDITVWNYYNGDQLESFNRLVSTFNETIGKAKGIRVSGSSQGTVNDLEANDDGVRRVIRQLQDPCQHQGNGKAKNSGEQRRFPGTHSSFQHVSSRPVRQMPKLRQLK